VEDSLSQNSVLLK